MRASVSGATGLIGPRLVRALLEEGAEVTVLSRDPERARARLRSLPGPVEAVAWDPLAQPAPAAALEGRDVVVHLTGASVAQRWSERAKRAIRDSRVRGTEHLVAGLAAASERPRTLICSSATGYYGRSGEEPLDEDSPPGSDFLARVCVDWEAQARRAGELGVRVVNVRTGIVLDPAGGALARMLPPFKLGLGGPIAGGRQFMPWIHHQDLIALMLAALRDERYAGPINATAPEPVSNREFSHVLGRVLRRPAIAPLPALALRAIFGEMAMMLTSGARAMPAKALVLGFRFAHPELEEALRAALARP
jgi:uncharacterized protein (TIGR01777 family)